MPTAAKAQTIRPEVAAQALERAAFSPTKSEHEQRAALVDKFSELDCKVKAFSPTKSEHERLRKLIVSWYPDLAGDKDTTVPGVQYDLLIGLAQEQQYIPSMPALYRRMKVMRFLELCSMTIKAVVSELGETEAAQYLDRKRTGPRTLTPIPKVKEAA